MTNGSLHLLVQSPSPLEGHDFRREKTIELAGLVTVTVFNSKTGEFEDLSNPGVIVSVRIGDAELASMVPNKGQWALSAAKPAVVSERETMTVEARFSPWVAKKVATVVFGDTTPPAIHLDPVEPTLNVPRAGATLTLTGRAADELSGVANVRWTLDQTTSGDATGPDAAGQWKASVNISSLGPHRIVIECRDKAGNVAEQLVPIVGVDRNPPELFITTSLNKPIQVPAVGKPQDTEGAITLEGLVSDQSAIASVEWSLDGRTYSPVSDLSALPAWMVTISGIGAVDSRGFLRTDKQRVFVRATDGPAGVPPNSAVASIDLSFEREIGQRPAIDLFAHTFSIAPVSVPTFALSLSEKAYLDDLLALADWLVGTRPGELDALFFQPFRILTRADTITGASVPLHRTRIAAGVLKAYIDSLALDAETARTLDEGLRVHYEEVYRTLLEQLGSSRDELVRARTADAASRAQLAQRLGFDLSAARPDELDQLVAVRRSTQEWREFLEQQFGYARVDRDVASSASVESANLETWRRRRLHAQWLAQDHPAHGLEGLPVLIDPDVVAADARPGTLAATLLSQRKATLAAMRAALAADRQPSETDLHRLERLVEGVVGPDIWTLNRDDVFAARQLETTAFDLLVRLRDSTRALSDISQQDVLLPAEWSDVYDILVQVQKVRLFVTWRVEEAAITISGSDFVRRPAAEAPRVSSFRAPETHRRRWARRLKARVDQEKVMLDGLQAVLLAAEDAMRSNECALYAAASGQEPDWLTLRLLIEVAPDPSQLNTRIGQAIETLQLLIFSLRARRFSSMAPTDGSRIQTWPPGDSPIASVAERVWQWMGSYSLWQAAMRVWLFPENLLYPQVRPDKSSRFDDMMAIVHTNGCRTATQAASAFDEYMALGEAKPATSRLPIAADVSDALNELRSIAVQRQGDVVHFRGVLAVLFHKYALEPLTRDPIQLNYLVEGCFFVPFQIAWQLQQAGQFTDALQWFGVLYAHASSLPVDERSIFAPLKLDRAEHAYTRGPITNWLETLNPHVIGEQRPNVYTRFVLLSLIRCLLDFADGEFTDETNDSIARARVLYLRAQELLRLPVLHVVPPAQLALPDISVLSVLVRRAETSLKKIRQGRNIAGLRRQQSFEQTDSGAGLIVSAEGQIQLAGAPGPPPTPYRYATLIERAKQLIVLAQQVETQYLAALEKRDAEIYNLMRARQDLDTAESRVTIQDLRVEQASESVTLAHFQEARSQTQADSYRQFIDAGPSQYEDQMIKAYEDANRYRNQMARLDAAITAAQAATTASSGGILGTGIGAAWGGFAAVSALAADKAGVTIDLNNADLTAQVASVRASQEYRVREWQLQERVARQDVRIAAQQAQIAADEFEIASEEGLLARKTAAHSRAAVEFLTDKFTNADLFNWMSGVLGGVYAYFLQQATSVARLAEHQLSFERQESQAGLIKSDYWRADATTSNDSSSSQDRRGLTGSARLLQAIYQLDQQAFETARRKQQLTRVVSLAAMAPFEFQQFRQNGMLTFRTPLSMFDSDFPGHYVRLIKRVGVSVIALIPPYQGIKATLSASGLSRVTVGDEVFQTITIHRDPETVALTSPANATGIFDLDAQPELLLPFEGIGVDTTWQFELPKASNSFDYRTIADVLLTIDYTALHDEDYRQSVVANMDLERSVERAYSLRQDFPDAWYEVNNPRLTDGPVSVAFRTSRGDFPPNLLDVGVQHALISIVRVEDNLTEMEVGLRVSTSQDGLPVSRSVFARRTRSGLLSTRRGDGHDWVPGDSAQAEWHIDFASEARPAFANDKIQDVLFVLTCSGRLPPWRDE